jgi:quercetin dioxygenase-like cupin family protein
VLTALKARSRIAPHQTEGRISIHALQGRIQVRAEGRTFNLPAGSLVALDQGIRHDVEALDDSAFLLTIAWHPERDAIGSRAEEAERIRRDGLGLSGELAAERRTSAR